MIAATGIPAASASRTGARSTRPTTRHTDLPADSRLSVAERRSILRRLDRCELEHLRQHAAELAERLDAAERDLAAADDAADHWREQCLAIELRDDERLGLTVDGTLCVVAATNIDGGAA